MQLHGLVGVVCLLRQPVGRSLIQSVHRTMIPICSAAEGHPRALPAAAARDIAAEAIAAASLFRPSSAPLFASVVDAPAEPRRIVVSTFADAACYQQLASEVVSDVTSGARAGTTWLKPLALRTCSNATMAEAAERYDPVIGWTGGSTLGDVHVFSSLAPAVFLPTNLLESAPPALALAVRSMSEVHAAAVADDLLAVDALFGAPPEDSSKLHAFMAGVTSQASARQPSDMTEQGPNPQD